MTQDAYWVRRGVEDKERQQRQLTDRERRTAERRARAWRAAFDGFPQLRCATEGNPDTKNHPCPWLVAAICNVSSKGPVKRGAVLAERRRLMGNQEQEAA